MEEIINYLLDENKLLMLINAYSTEYSTLKYFI